MLQDRVRDALKFGVPHVWVIDSRKRRGHVYTQDETIECLDGYFAAGPLIRLSLDDLDI
jgi:Uma2 family endonuclease